MSSIVDKWYMAYSFNWPYFGYASKMNYVFVLNAFNPNFIQRYQLPLHIHRCVKTFLTDTHDLYVMCESDMGYEMYNIDLDSPEPYLEGPLFEYNYEQVNS